MIQKLMICFAIASLAFVAPRAAAAPPPITHLFDTVDAVQLYFEEIGGNHYPALVVRGIRAGASTPTTTVFYFSISASDRELSARCERLALMAVAKPGKLKLGIGATGTSSLFGHTCQLLQVSP